MILNPWATNISTRAAMTVSISDMTVPPQKPELIARAQDTVDRITRNYKRGLITDEERYKRGKWRPGKRRTMSLTHALLSGLDKYNNIFMMAGPPEPVVPTSRLSSWPGMRGLMADTTGHTIELPIKSNFREGLDVLEYFMSAHGARKGLSDTALRTADSGYLTPANGRCFPGSDYPGDRLPGGRRGDSGHVCTAVR